MRLYDKIWFIDAYGNLCHGTITAINTEENYCSLGGRSVRLDQCYPSKESCLAAERARHEAAVKAYLDEITSMQDMIVFMYNHTVAKCEEYTDWDAREAVRQKALAFGIELSE